MTNQRLAIGSDHAGFLLKEKIRKHLLEKGYLVEDKGCYSEERADYPDFGHAVAQDVDKKAVDLGIIICGSGNGINMAANKHAGVRSALCWIPEIASLARQHNDANVLALPARFITESEAYKIIDAFLSGTFEGGRHADRVNKINC
jgi:ribose 5-phosphate isomerase B